ELAGAVDRSVDVRLGGQVEDDVGTHVGERSSHAVPVANVALKEAVARAICDVRQVVEVAGVGQPIVNDDVRIGFDVEQVVNEVRADETGAARHEVGSPHFTETMNRPAPWSLERKSAGRSVATGPRFDDEPSMKPTRVALF